MKGFWKPPLVYTTVKALGSAARRQVPRGPDRVFFIPILLKILKQTAEDRASWLMRKCPVKLGLCLFLSHHRMLWHAWAQQVKMHLGDKTQSRFVFPVWLLWWNTHDKQDSICTAHHAWARRAWSVWILSSRSLCLKNQLLRWTHIQITDEA